MPARASWKPGVAWLGRLLPGACLFPNSWCGVAWFLSPSGRWCVSGLPFPILDPPRRLSLCSYTSASERFEANLNPSSVCKLDHIAVSFLGSFFVPVQLSTTL